MNLSKTTFADRDISPTTRMISNSDQLNGLVGCISRLTVFDSIVILGYVKKQPPFYLYNPISRENLQLLEGLMSNSYSYDHLYSKFINTRKEGVFFSRELFNCQDEFLRYQQQVTQDCQRGDEVAISIRIDSNRKIVIYLRRTHLNDGFSRAEVNQLKSSFQEIKNQWLSSWQNDHCHHGDTLAEMLPRALGSFGSDLLTVREQEITSLTIQGLDNRSISEQLEISIATVKVHKKSLYAKLGISSVGELFQLFLNYLLLISYRHVFKAV